MGLRLLTAYSFLTITLFACSKSHETREWTPEDHTQPAMSSTGAPKTPPRSAMNSVYQSHCSPCHGPTGKGDGPMGRSLRVTDLSSAAWQRKVSDKDISDVIINGRGKMPGNKMSPNKVNSLVKKVRSFGKRPN